MGNCSINGISLPYEKTVTSSRPVLIPFISIGNYLRKFSLQEAYTPEDALKIGTPYGMFRLWANEQGVMYARDTQDDRSSHEGWKAKKLLGITRAEHGGKKLFLASLVLKAIKDKSNKDKFKIALEPIS